MRCAAWELVALVPEDRFDAAKIYRDKKLRTAAHSARLAWYMVEMPNEDSVMIRAGASDKPVTAAAVGGIADFDEIMQGVHKQNMRRILR